MRHTMKPYPLEESAMSYISVPVSTDQFVELNDFLRNHRVREDPVKVIHAAIDYWMQNADWKEEVLRAVTGETGYQWKNLHLPDGTKLRIRHQGKDYIAEVVQSDLIYDSEEVTPNKFCELVHKGRNRSTSSWRSIWVLIPGKKDWKKANELRSKDRKINRDIERLVEEAKYLADEAKPSEGEDAEND